MPAPRRAADLWWLHPARIVLLVVVPVYLGALMYDLRKVVANVYIPGWDYAFGGLLVLALALGAQLAGTGTAESTRQAAPRISLGLMMFLLGTTVVTYTIWFGPLLWQPQLLMEIVRGERAELRESLSTVKGLTTFTQFGVAYVIAYALKRSAGVQPLRRIEHIGLALVFGLAAFRAFAWAERLAVLELLVCFTVARLAYLDIGSERRWRVASLAPVVAPLGVYLLFTLGEYFRSWEYYVKEYDTVWHYTAERLIAYYATAINNGIGALVDTHDWPYFRGAFILESLYRMPGLGAALDAVFGDPVSVPVFWLEVYARPEFNSQTDYFRIVLDLGYAGAAIYYLVLGYVFGRAYHGYRAGRRFGLLMYGVIVLHLIESLRYGYLGEPRFVPLAVGLVLVAHDMRRLRAQAVNAEWQQSNKPATSP